MPYPILIATIMREEGDTGVQTHVRTFLEWLTRNNVPARLITPFHAPPWKVYPAFALRRAISKMSGPAGVWWYRHWHAVFLHSALQDALADIGPGVIYAQCPVSANAALRARASTSQRVIMVTHFNLSQADEWADKGEIAPGGALFNSIREFEESILPRLDGLVFVSEFMRRELIRRIPDIKKTPYRVLPNFLSDPHSDERQSIAQTDLISIGTLEPRKNQRYALEILSAARGMGWPLKLTIVGRGADRPALEALANRYGVAGDVYFHGHAVHAATLLPNHRAYLHVAKIENLPLTLIEALSRGIPVFAPAVGGIPEIFNDGIEGRMIPLDDAKKAASMILEWIRSPRMLREAGDAARARFDASFRAEKVAARLMDFLVSPSPL